MLHRSQRIVVGAGSGATGVQVARTHHARSWARVVPLELRGVRLDHVIHRGLGDDLLCREASGVAASVIIRAEFRIEARGKLPKLSASFGIASNCRIFLFEPFFVLGILARGPLAALSLGGLPRLTFALLTGVL